MIAATPVRHVIARMLMNLRGIYASRGDFAQLLVVLDRLIDILPDGSEELRDRGLLLGRLGGPFATWKPTSSASLMRATFPTCAAGSSAFAVPRRNRSAISDGKVLLALRRR
jgi:hypothetical protein